MQYVNVFITRCGAQAPNTGYAECVWGWLRSPSNSYLFATKKKNNT